MEDETLKFNKALPQYMSMHTKYKEKKVFGIKRKCFCMCSGLKNYGTVMTLTDRTSVLSPTSSFYISVGSKVTSIKVLTAITTETMALSHYDLQ